jgi:hypothetical protein
MKANGPSRWRRWQAWYSKYIDRTWIGHRSIATRTTNTSNRRKPRFSHDLWNHFQLQMGTEREDLEEMVTGTNNYLKSYNRTLNKLPGRNSNGCNGAPITAIVPIAVDLLPLQITKPVPSRPCGTIIPHGWAERKWVSRHQFFTAGCPMNMDKPHFSFFRC